MFFHFLTTSSITIPMKKNINEMKQIFLLPLIILSCKFYSCAASTIIQGTPFLTTIQCAEIIGEQKMRAASLISQLIICIGKKDQKISAELKKISHFLATRTACCSGIEYSIKELQRVAIILESVIAELRNNTKNFKSETVLERAEKDLSLFSLPYDLKLAELIHKNNTLLEAIELEIKQYDLSYFAQTARSLDSHLHSWGAYKLCKRAAPYLGLVSYLYLTTSKTCKDLADKHELTKEEAKPLTPSLVFYGKKIVQVTEKPLFELSILSLFIPIIKRDATDLYNWLENKAIEIKSAITQESVPTQNITKKSKLLLSDVVNHEAAREIVSPILHYLKNRDLYVLSGAEPTRGYFFSGDSTLAKNWAYALAGEITKQQKKVCGYYQIHASTLNPESVKDLGKNLCAEAPCVFIIEELDWLFQKENYEPKTIRCILELLSSLLKTGKKEFVTVFATSQSPENIPASFLTQAQLTCTLSLSGPTLEERFAFFKEKLSNFPAYEQFDLHYIAANTHGCSWKQLEALLSEAVMRAHVSKEILTPAHIEREIDRQVRGIIQDEAELSYTKRRMQAAKVAGHIVAFNELFPDGKIAKATILSDIKKGDGVYTYRTHDEYISNTDNHLFNQLIYKVAGKEAQKIVLSNSYCDDPQASNQAYQCALLLASQGLDTTCMPEKIQEYFHQKALDLYQQAQTAARELLERKRKLLERFSSDLEQNVTLYFQAVSGQKREKDLQF